MSDDYCLDCLCCHLMSQKWTPQIVSVLLSGPRRFSALHAAIPGLSDKVLSRRLTELEEAGIVTRAQYPEIPPRVEYTLTETGLALRGVIAEMERWSAQFAPRRSGTHGSRSRTGPQSALTPCSESPPPG